MARYTGRGGPGVNAFRVVREERALGQQRSAVPLLGNLHWQAALGLLIPDAVREVVAVLGSHGEPAPPHWSLHLGREPDPLFRQPERRRARRALAVVEGHRLVRPRHPQVVEEHRPAGVELRTELHPDHLVRHAPLPADASGLLPGLTFHPAGRAPMRAVTGSAHRCPPAGVLARRLRDRGDRVSRSWPALGVQLKAARFNFAILSQRLSSRVRPHLVLE